jgi:hypothetical protein
MSKLDKFNLLGDIGSEDSSEDAEASGAGEDEEQEDAGPAKKRVEVQLEDLQAAGFR